MPNLPSARKRMRSSEKRRRGNRAVKSRLHTLRRKFWEAIAAKDRTHSEKSFRQYCSALDKAVKQGVIKRGNADRNKSRASLRLNALLVTPEAHQ
ncbi:MAG: 30S ribosomal protein S20 [Kiritimatiellia bacterium]